MAEVGESLENMADDPSLQGFTMCLIYLDVARGMGFWNWKTGKTSFSDLFPIFSTFEDSVSILKILPQVPLQLP